MPPNSACASSAARRTPDPSSITAPERAAREWLWLGNYILDSLGSQRLRFRVNAQPDGSRYPPSGHSRPQYVEAGVPVPVNHKAAMRACVYPHGQ